MGRFASCAEFYSRYREPYPPAFFKAIAEKLNFSGVERLLDVGCGPGLLAIGLSPYIHSATGIDPEPSMLVEARNAAAAAGVSLHLVQGHIEDFSSEVRYELVTIGRALHWLDREPSLKVFDKLLSENGHILICGASNAENSISPWLAAYKRMRHSWVDGDMADQEKFYRVNFKEWFAGSAFTELGTVAVTERRKVTVEELILRALSKSNTSPELLGEKRNDFEAGLRSVLEPFTQDGFLNEEIVARATIFARHP